MTQAIPDDAPNDARVRRLILRSWTALLAVAWGALSLHPDYGSDVFFHLTLGREVLRTHTRVVAERWALPGLHERCAVPEWLWDVVASLLHRGYGWGGVAALVIGLAVLAAWACCRLASSRSREAASVVLVTAAISPLVLARIQERPEAAVMVLAPCLVLLSERLGAAEVVRERAKTALQLVLVVLLWAQVHPSFVLAPLLVAIVAGDRLVRADRRLAVATTLGLAIASLTSAQGVQVFAYTLKHASSYAVSRVTEWSPPSWDMLDPARNIHLPLYAALWIVGLGGTARAQRLPRRELALALFGLLLVVRGRRNIGLGAELLVPFAVAGVDALLAGASPRVARAAVFASLAASIVVFVKLAAMLDVEVGPLGAIGPPEGLFPSRAAAFLAHAPTGTRVLTTYEAGAPLGFWLDGHVRTSLDGRTLLYFDDPEYAAARASWEDAGALDRMLHIYGIDAAVVDRTNPVCALLAAKADWEPILVEAAQTTFTRKEAYRGPSIGHLAPCGSNRFTTDACDDASALVRELDAQAGNPFLDELRVEARIRCGGEALDADALVAMLPARARASGFLADRDGALAWILAHAGRLDQAIDLVSPYILEGDVRAAARVAWVLDQHGDPRLGPMLERLAAIHGDEAPPWLFALLANACARDGRLDCAATYGIFAGAKGEVEAAPALCAVSTKHADPVTRNEALLWLEALRRAKQGATSLTCP